MTSLVRHGWLVGLLVGVAALLAMACGTASPDEKPLTTESPTSTVCGHCRKQRDYTGSYTNGDQGRRFAPAHGFRHGNEGCGAGSNERKGPGGHLDANPG